ncbi:MAG: type VI secretion system baseplate subunit TssK [Planctomycetota bacterium]
MSSASEPSILWREGMFLCPQHFQTFARQVEARIHTSERIGRVGDFGLLGFAVDADALARDVFHLESVEAVFRDGTHLQVPQNGQIDQREFGEFFTKAELDVFLGIPARRAGSPELGAADDARARYHAESVGVFDENLKDEPRELEVRVLHARVFFGEEDRSGFESIPLARLVRKGKPVAVSALSDDFVPPVLACGASTVLSRRLAELASAVRAQSRDLAARIPNTTGLSSVEKGADIAGFVKLQAVNQCVATLEQITRLPELHPFPVYMALVQSVGNLAIFGAERVVPELPAYDHDEIDACFASVVQTAQSLIPAEVTVPYDTAPFREDPMRQGFHICEIPPEWIERHPLVFVGVELGKPVDEVVQLVQTGTKLLAEADLEKVLTGVIPGVQLDYVRTAPLAFPKRPDLHFFRVQTEGASREGWLKIEQAGTAVILTALGGIGARFHFYVELRG